MLNSNPRKRLRRRARSWMPCLAAGACLLVVAPAWSQEFERSFSYDGDELWIANLIGEVQVRGHSGPNFEVTARVRGEDATNELIQFDAPTGRRGELRVLFPTREHRNYVYPEMGRNSRTQFRPHNRRGDGLGRLLDLGRGGIEVRGRSFRNSIEVWVDLEVLVPRGKETAIFLGVGSLKALDIEGNLEFDTSTGSVDVDQLRGDLLVDTRSGSVRVSRVTGNVDVDTGSGGVEVHEVKQAKVVRVDTGSGSVEVTSIEAGELNIDTGSGSVDVDGAAVEELLIDTGSGGVEALAIETDGAKIDTGSGGVRLELKRMGRGDYEVDTGSGGIRLTLPRDVSAEFDVETNSGGIHVDIDGVRLPRRPRNEARFTVGDGNSRVTLSTGSGSVRIQQRG